MTSRLSTVAFALCAAFAACREAPPAKTETVSVTKEEARATATAQARSASSSPAPAQTPPTLEIKAAEGTSAPGAATGSLVPGATAAAAPSPSTAPAAASATTTSGKAASAEPLAGESRQGSVVNDAAFSTWLQVKSPVAAGSPAQVEAVLVAKPPYHCNAEYPHKFTFNEPPPGLEYPEKLVRGMKVTPERGELSLPVVAKAPGSSTVTGTLSFSVCTEERCLVEKRELQVALDVK